MGHNKGFTLVELAIVIVIIGLLVGGVLAGQELVKQAENSRLIATVDSFKAATLTFKSKYNQYPGDTNKAILYWGAASSCPGGISTGTETCNGNGDNNISLWEDSAQHNEFFRYWQHLGNAKLIKGQYTGATTNATWHVPNVNAPQGPHKGSLFGILNTRLSTGGSLQTGSGGFTGLMGHFYTYGTQTANGHPWGAVMAADNAMSIDRKVDDGIPGRGTWTVLAQGSTYTANCVNGTDPATATYNVSSSQNECSFVIFPGY